MVQKRLVSLFALLGLFITVSYSVSAQIDDTDLTESIVSDGGMSVRYPDGWFAESTAPETITLTFLGSLTTLSVLTGEDIRAVNATVETDAQAMVEEYRTIMRIMVTGEVPEIETVELANGTAYLWIYALVSDVPDTGVIGIQLDNGATVGVLVNAFGGPFDDLREDVLTILATVETGAEATIEPTVPMNLIAEDDLPDNAVLLVGDIAFVPPEGYNADDLESGDATATLITEDFSNVLTIGVVDDVTYAFLNGALLAGLVPGVGDGSLELDDVVEVIVLDDGREIRFYSSANAVDAVGAVGVYAEFDVTNDQIIYVLVNVFGEVEIEAIEADVLALVDSVAIIEGGASDPAAVDADEVVTTETMGGTAQSSTPQPNDSGSAPLDVTCGDDLLYLNYSVEGSVQIACPAGCQQGDGTVWGSSPYTNDSAACVAAIHAGALNAEAGGIVNVTFSEGLESYTGTTANGITTSDYGPWAGSITFSAGE